MPGAFLAVAETCAPMVDPAALAAIVRLESSFNPLAIRVHSDAVLKGQPATKQAAVAAANDLLAKRAEFSLGLGGLSVEIGRKYGLSLEEMFDPCRNLAVTGELLAGYLRASAKAGAGDGAFGAAFARYFGQGEEEAGYLAGYDQRALSAMAELRPLLPELPLTIGSHSVAAEKAATEEARPAPGKRSAAPLPSAPPWDVYGNTSGSRSHVLIFTP
ncbi:transglycosylase SLT domain-containing protein [Ancylobacter sp. FA202]|uniref:transglycosylase SLT domain-containing protein n=1 Tax=Ancylobacter sp. FA202 TaxID=1111106 RepID=UPI0003A5ADA8|nr:transglycosylase SLT domain-containing protein [Ancylobacter sp. FA202]